jgi:hypothetical protein
MDCRCSFKAFFFFFFKLEWGTPTLEIAEKTTLGQPGAHWGNLAPRPAAYSIWKALARTVVASIKFRMAFLDCKIFVHKHFCMYYIKVEIHFTSQTCIVVPSY